MTDDNMTSKDMGDTYKDLADDDGDFKGIKEEGEAEEVKARPAKDSKTPVILGPQWSRSGKSFASGSAASPKANKEKFGALSKDINAGFLAVAGSVDPLSDTNGRPAFGRHDSRGRSRFSDLAGSEETGTGNSGRSFDRGDYKRSYSRGDTSNERSEGGGGGGGSGGGGSFRTFNRAESFGESAGGGRSFSDSRSLSRSDGLDRGDDRRLGGDSRDVNSRDDRRQSQGEGPKLTRRASGRG